MKDLLLIIEYLKNYVDAIGKGIDKFAEALPILTKQHMTTLANRRLDSTKEEYLSNIKIKMNDYILVVELNTDSWLANAVETGVGQFDMKEGLLNSPKARVGKSGARYIRIPIGKDPNKKNEGGSEKSKEFQQRIVDVLMKPKFGSKKIKMNPDGSLFESQKVLAADPMVAGLYRTRQFEQAEDYYAGKKKPKWQYVLFRTVSEKPSKTGATWEHPGIQPVRIFTETERWLDQSIGQLLDDFIQSEVEALNHKTGA